MLTRGRFLHGIGNYVLATAETVFLQHVIARSTATRQSASPQKLQIRLKCCDLLCTTARRTDCHRCAHWFAMTCRRRMRCCRCKEVVPGCCQERYLQTLTRSKFQHVIARSEATWQSVLLAVQHRRKQYLRRIRSRLQIRPKAHLSLPFPAGTRIATGVRTGSQ